MLRLFSDFQFNTISALYLVFFKDPTPIQRMAIPIGLLNRDIIGIAETGHLYKSSVLYLIVSYQGNLIIV